MPHVDRGNTMLRLIRRTKTASIVVTRARSTQRKSEYGPISLPQAVEHPG